MSLPQCLKWPSFISNDCIALYVFWMNYCKNIEVKRKIGTKNPIALLRRKQNETECQSEPTIPSYRVIL